MELMKSDGSLATGILCLYLHTQGHFIYSECAIESSEGYTFEAAKSLIIKVGMANKDGQTPYQLFKMAGGLFAPSKVFVPKALIVQVQDTTDAQLISLARSTLSGIVLPPGPKLN
jgi:hypothetical protein